MNARRTAVIVLLLLLAMGVAWWWFGYREPPHSARSSAPDSESDAAAAPTSSDATGALHELIVTVKAGARGVSDAPILLYGPLGNPRDVPQQTQTSAQGVARFSRQPRGRYLIVVRHPLYAAARHEVDLLALRTDVAILLEPGVTVAGEVVDARGRPIPDATARATLFAAAAREPTPEDELGTARTDAAGRFEIGSLPLRSYRVYVHASRYRPRYSEPIVFSKHGDRREVRIALDEGLTLRGRVLDAERRPVQGATVGTSGEASLLAQTDATGSFELMGLSAELVNLFATAEGFAPTHVHRVAPGRRDVELVLQQPARLTGTIRLRQPADSLRLEVCRFENAFNKEICVHAQIYEPPAESFDLRNLPAGTYDVVISLDNREAARRSVTLIAGQSVALEIDVTAAAR